MFITIITPVKNAAYTIERCINSVLNQHIEEEFELIIIEGGSTDKTPEILRRCVKEAKGRIRVFKEPGKGPAFARNIGIRNARGDIIAFIDADCEANEEWLIRLIQPFKNENVDGVCGSIKTPKGLGIIGELVGLDWEYRQEERNIKKLKWFHFMNTAYKKEVFEKVGFLNEELITGEDQEFFRRLQNEKLKVLFIKDAVVYHYHRSTFSGYIRQFFNYGRGSYKIFKKFKNIETILLFSYFFMLLISLVLVFLIRMVSFFLTLFFLGFGKYMYNGMIIFYKSKDLKSLLIGPLSFMGRFSSFLGFIYSFYHDIRIKLRIIL